MLQPPAVTTPLRPRRTTSTTSIRRIIILPQDLRGPFEWTGAPTATAVSRSTTRSSATMRDVILSGARGDGSASAAPCLCCEQPARALRQRAGHVLGRPVTRSGLPLRLCVGCRLGNAGRCCLQESCAQGKRLRRRLAAAWYGHESRPTARKQQLILLATSSGTGSRRRAHRPGRPG